MNWTYRNRAAPLLAICGENRKQNRIFLRVFIPVQNVLSYKTYLVANQKLTLNMYIHIFLLFKHFFTVRLPGPNPNINIMLHI